MMKRLLLAAAVTATTAAGVVYLAAGPAAASKTHDITVIEHDTNLQDEATHTAPDFTKPIPPGDTLVFTADLTEHSTKVGDGHGVCTDVFDTHFVCNVVFTIAGRGDLDLQVLFDEAAPSGDYAIVGGTGAYAEASGTGRYTTLANGDSRHTIHLHP